jgi:predicted permease
MFEFLRRLRYLLHRRSFDNDLAGDLEFHREMAAREGRQLGNTLRLREEARDVWGWTWIERLSQDLRYATRMLRRSPGFTIAAVLTLAIGIGINVAVFGFFNLMIFRPLPVRDPDSILRFLRTAPQNFWSDLPYPEVAFFSEHARTLSAVLASNEAQLQFEAEENRLHANFVTSNFFRDLGSSAAAGRVIDPAIDDAPASEPVVVLSYGFWQQHFGADPAAVGKVIQLNGKPATIIGVAPDQFSGLRLSQTDLWLPIKTQPYFVAGSQLLTDFSPATEGVMMWGRLRPGLAPKVAEDELRSLAAELRKQHPLHIWENETLLTEPGGYASFRHGHSRGSGDNDRHEAYPIVALVCTLSLLILVVSCGNLGSLLLARGVAREREISIRTAVGAGRSRIVRQLFTESLLLAILGTIAGLVLGEGAFKALFVLTKNPVWFNPLPDWRVILFSMAAGFFAAVLFGLTPSLEIARGRHRSTRLRQYLVGAQVAASCVLLIVAGLLVRALNHVMSTNPGFEYEQVVSIDPHLLAHGFSPAAAKTYLTTLQNRFRGLQGVEAVSLASNPPLGHKTTTLGTEIEGRQFSVSVNHIDPEFFATMKIPILRGRNLLPGDSNAIIISQSMARQWPSGDPLGKHFSSDGATYTVIGIAGDARTMALRDPDAVEGYFLIGESDLPSLSLLVRTAGSPRGLISFVTSITKSIDPRVLPEIELLQSSFRRTVQGTENSALLASILGLTALLLACLGIVGLITYAVAQRTKEIGIRMALGANSSQVLSLILRRFSPPVLIGLLFGVLAAAALSQMLRRELYGVSNLDPFTYCAAVAFFAITIALSAIVPAKRALRVDPIRALRYD